MRLTAVAVGESSPPAPFPLDPVVRAIGTLVEECEIGGANHWTDPFTTPGNVLENPKNYIAKLNELVETALDREGRVTVRYLGDLKEMTCPYEEVDFFHLSEVADPKDVREVIRRSMAQAAENGRRLVNLSNVRDIQIKVGATGIHQSVSTVERFTQTLEDWTALGLSNFTVQE